MLKLGRKQLPTGYNLGDFTYQGRPAVDQGDFGTDVGIADMACVNQFGEANNSKGYHSGVIKSSDGGWWVYLEWGRIKAGKSWQAGRFCQQDFQFVQCTSESEARTFFKKQLSSKNIKRLVQKTVGGATIWAAKPKKDGYIVQSLATRERGLPDAYSIKDSTGVSNGKTNGKTATPTAKKKKTATPTRNFQSQVIDLARDLVGGTQTYTRTLSKASGIVPTMAAITQVRDQLVPAALTRIALAGNDVQDQLRDNDLKSISKMVYAMVPRHIPRSGLQPEDAILNTGNILSLQQDLNAFEAALSNEDFSIENTTTTIDPNQLLNANLTWLNPKEELGRWVANTYRAMTRNRHGDLRGQRLRVRNIFAIERPGRDQRFINAVKTIAKKRQGRKFGTVLPGLQPSRRPDLADVGDWATDANIFIGIHGTRGVNIAPILGSHFRLPKSLAGVQITGAAFGHGVYFATDVGKSFGYTGHSNRWGGGGGSIRNRGAFMFLCDVAGGKFFYPRSAWSINGAKCPEGGDSVYAHPSKIPSLQNDEHVIFDPSHCRIRYLIEMIYE